jgi:shikimate dehydrogenase
MNCYGLIGFPLTHSFSKRYFTEKFVEMGISDTHHYELFELQDYTQLPQLVQNQPDLRGLNVTIPHKQNVLPYLDEITDAARRIGAVNVIKITNDKRLIGYNSDYYGFRLALEELLPANYKGIKALVLGNGGAAKAVKVALEDMGILYETVTRKPEENTILYANLKDYISDNQLLINTTPLGTYPDTITCPALPYELLTEKHYLFDLVYNPETTLFMQKGIDQGAAVKNGYRMLVLQAEKSWEIWNQ